MRWCDGYRRSCGRPTGRRKPFEKLDRPALRPLSTRPFVFAGKELLLNFATSAPGFLRVEIQDADGKPVPGYSLDDSQELIGNYIEHPARWRGGTDVSELAGRPIRLHFSMKDADLYSLRFKPACEFPPAGELPIQKGLPDPLTTHDRSRVSKHGDRQVLLCFADKFFFGKKVNRRFDVLAYPGVEVPMLR